MSSSRRNSGGRSRRSRKHSYARPGRGSNRSGGRRSQKSSLQRSDLVSQPAHVQKEQSESVQTRPFSSLDLPSELHKAIQAKQYHQMTPIQDQVIEPVMAGQDMLGIANTGTGKTAAFIVPILAQLHRDPAQRVLIMAPTRELALQIDTELRSLRGQIKAYSVLCIGGTKLYKQTSQLKWGYSVIVGTPGRVKDLIDRGHLDLSTFKLVVLDEVDRMLDMGFVHDMRQIFKHLPQQRQSLFFSATMDGPVRQLVNEFSDNVSVVSVKQQETTANVHQDVIEFSTNNHKIQLLKELLGTDEVGKALVFGRTKRGVNKLAAILRDNGFQLDAIHGNKSQNQRERALKKFRQDRINILVATDVAARGLDIQGVSHVINFDLPDTYQDYVHRIGRTGRADQTGKALSFVRK